jgi:flagellar biosynthetic protein FlhB
LAGEKTEKATPKRKKDERKKGNVFQSQEVIVVASLIVVFYAFKFLAPMILTTLMGSIRDYIEIAVKPLELDTYKVRSFFIDGCLTFAIAAVPLLFIANLVSITLTLAQTRLLVSFKSIAPKGNRLSPIQGFKKMFSMRGVVELLKSLLKITVLGYILYDIMKDELPVLPRMMDMSVRQVMAATGEVILSIVRTAAIFFAFIALFDYVYQWWEYEKNLRMSKQEIKEEYKETEGDPQIKGKIKEKQQMMARQRMMQSVPSADVVIRNPTHFAVAIRYDPDKDRAPVVVAKGADRLALKIVAVAEEHGIAVTENVPLARALYDAVELEMEIPSQFYQPVAEVLAFVYSLKKKDLKHEVIQ